MLSQFTQGQPGSNRNTSVLPVDGKTLADVFLRRAELAAGNSRTFLVKRDGRYTDYPWADFYRGVVGTFAGLRAAGIQPGDRVGIFSNSRPEWCITDMAGLCLGAMTVPLYQSSSPEDIAYILDHCGAKLVFVEDEKLLARMREVLPKLATPPKLVIFDGPGSEEAVAFSKFAQADDFAAVEKELRKSAQAIEPATSASIVYTSGTTGRPKGVVLTHANFTAELRSVVSQARLVNTDITLTFLPFAHIFGRAESFLPVFAGITLGFAENINTVAADMLLVRPTILCSVPRIYEKIYARILNELERAPDTKKKVFHWAVKTGRQYAQLLSEKKRIPLPLQLKYLAADRLVFSKVREKLGGRLRLTVSGGAPLNAELCQFFHACGVKVLEGYGLTETTAAVVINYPDDYAFGTVGKPVADTEIRIAADGEILLRGAVVFKEYFNNPEATAEVLSKDGWFATGDIGEITDRGMLKITDRKKELIVTSGGKNIAPQKLENRIKASRFLSNGLVYGDKRQYLVALVTLNEAAIQDWGKAQGLEFQGLSDMASDEAVRRLVETEFRSVNEGLASYESIKKFKVLDIDFGVESGELTPSLKLKRKVIITRFQQEIEALY